MQSESNIITAENEELLKQDEPDEKSSFNSKFGAVLRAFLANVGIALIKLVCWYISKSSAMLSESVHSGVDAFNSLCLMVGLKRGSRPADNNHQFGYGLEANIWTLFACLIMLGATLTATSHGIRVLINGELDDLNAIITNFPIIAISLIASILFELWAVNSATKAVLLEAKANYTSNFLINFFNSIKYIKKITTPTTKFVWFEDVIAFTGAFIALTALILVINIPNEFAHFPDAIASIIIGLMLLSLAINLLINNVNFLTGQAAEPHIEEIIKDVAGNIHGISEVHELKTMDMGTSGIIVNMNIEVAPNTQVKDADDIADMLERKIRKRIKKISHVNIEIQAHDAEDNWEEKYEKLIKEGEQIKAIDAHEAQMLSNFYKFANTVVKEIMVPRTKTQFIDVESSLKEAANLIITSGHTRIPVYEETIDNVIGVINAKDVLKSYTDNNTTNYLKQLVRDILIIPENKFISDLLSDLISSKSQMAAIIDEHGGIAGIVTIEDIIEEIVGEIYDEFDKIELPDLIVIDENTLDVSSQKDIEDLNNDYDLDIPTDDFQTIGGYVFGLIGREPEKGDIVEDKNITFTVLDVEGRRISRIKMVKTTPFSKAEEDNTNISDNTENTQHTEGM